MILGIVGSEAAKFVAATEARARQMIRDLIREHRATLVVSGACHLGGVDVFAIEEARRLGVAAQEFPPRVHTWADGYKPRNMQIGTVADHVVCLTVRHLPPHYTGMRFPFCYHCGTRDHVKSGGCWTVKYARSLGKPGTVLVIESERRIGGPDVCHTHSAHNAAL